MTDPARGRAEGSAADAAPYRTPAAAVDDLGWASIEQGTRRTIFARDRTSEASTRKVLGPALVLASLALRFTGGVSSGLVLGLASVLAVGIAASWPISRETIVVDADGLTWKDRVLGLRARFALGRIRVRVQDVPRSSERAVSIGDGNLWQLVARGEPRSADELAVRLRGALARAGTQREEP